MHLDTFTVLLRQRGSCATGVLSGVHCHVYVHSCHLGERELATEGLGSQTVTELKSKGRTFVNNTEVGMSDTSVPGGAHGSFLPHNGPRSLRDVFMSSILRCTLNCVPHELHMPES